jgi:hypothetical protein
MVMVEFLDDIAIDASKAFNYMAVMLNGEAGFTNEPERLHWISFAKFSELLPLSSLLDDYNPLNSEHKHYIPNIPNCIVNMFVITHKTRSGNILNHWFLV